MDTDQQILAIIEAEPIRDQASLLARLAEQGIQLTQPTLSRHLHKLSIRKQDGRYRVSREPVTVLPRMDISLVPPNLVILKTDPGHAQMLGLHLDKRQPEGMAGTVAGDDTIFIAAEAGTSLEDLRERVLDVFGRDG
ncbi:arginine repressor [Gammaproteobacteria bacterium AB-CW1]|uniref:Arginine repressor n=1 Tax=Natronospira elongata TaxID=3110268 RepID=A0AAP6JEY5_9GAMM|nr:arginine repressor [Gammaproteobacteria bacterium AB-CW1]